MHDLNLIDPALAGRVRQRREEFWEGCVARLESWIGTALGLDWEADPGLTQEEVYEELQFGRS